MQYEYFKTAISTPTHVPPSTTKDQEQGQDEVRGTRVLHPKVLPPPIKYPHQHTSSFSPLPRIPDGNREVTSPSAKHRPTAANAWIGKRSPMRLVPNIQAPALAVEAMQLTGATVTTRKRSLDPGAQQRNLRRKRVHGASGEITTYLLIYPAVLVEPSASTSTYGRT